MSGWNMVVLKLSKIYYFESHGFFFDSNLTTPLAVIVL